MANRNGFFSLRAKGSLIDWRLSRLWAGLEGSRPTAGGVGRGSGKLDRLSPREGEEERQTIFVIGE